MRWPRRTSKSRSAAVVSGPGAAPATAASYSSTSSARPRGGESFETGVKVMESVCVESERSITAELMSVRGKRLLHGFRELVVRRSRELVEREHPVCDASRRVDDEQVAVVDAAARRAIQLADLLPDVAGEQDRCLEVASPGCEG